MLSTIHERIRAYLKRSLRQPGLDDDTDIFANGMVDSLFAVQLVAFTEQEFGIVVEDDDLDLANFRSINDLADFVGRRRTGV